MEERFKLSEEKLIIGLHHAGLRAVDFSDTVRFYTEGLGFKKMHSWLKDGERVILLDSGNGSCIEVFEGIWGKRKREGAFFHVALHNRCGYGC